MVKNIGWVQLHHNGSVHLYPSSLYHLLGANTAKETKVSGNMLEL